MKESGQFTPYMIDVLSGIAIIDRNAARITVACLCRALAIPRVEAFLRLFQVARLTANDDGLQGISVEASLHFFRPSGEIRNRARCDLQARRGSGGRARSPPRLPAVIKT